MTTLPPPLQHLPDPILVVGGYGYRNTGDEAILASILRSLEGRRVTVLSRTPAETTAMHGVRSVPLTAAGRALAGHRTVLIGGGGLFGRDMGGVGRLLPAYGLGALALGRTVVIHGVGIDHGLPATTALPLRELAKRAHTVSVRDGASADVLRTWGIEAVVGPDLSTWLPAAPAAVGARLLRSAGIDPRRPVIGLALTAVNPDLAGPVLEAAAAAVNDMPDAQFCFIPMSEHPFVASHNDAVLGRRLKARVPRVAVLEGTPHPAALLAAYGHLAAVVGMRYHSLLFAARAGVPLIPVPYADKCDTWIAESGVKPAAADGRAWVKRLKDALEHRPASRSRRAAS